jgi:glycosyltransferase involved in cell wall biosynthesis
MKILYLCPDLGIHLEGHKGASAHVRDLVKAFTNLGHEVEVIALSNGVNNGLNSKITPLTVSILYERLSSDDPSPILRALRHIWNNVTVEKLLDGVLNDFNPDILYERYSPFGVTGVVMANKTGIPHVLEVNAPLAWEGKQFRKQALADVAEELEQIILKMTSLIITVSKTMRDILIDYGVPGSRIAVVPNGVDVNNFNCDDTLDSKNSRDKFVIGFVGSMKSWHGIDILANAFRELSFDPSFHLLVVGDGSMGKVIRVLRDEFPDRITLTGAVPHNEVASHIRSMDLAVAPYPKLDNFYFSPLKILEYMAVGKAVVAAEIGQIKELIDHGRTGFLVPPGDYISLANTIKNLHANKELCYSVGRQAADEVKREHTWNHRASDIINIINNINTAAVRGDLIID